MKLLKSVAVVLFGVALSGCGENSGEELVYSSSTSCGQVWSASGIEDQQSYQNGLRKFPEITEEYKRELVRACESAKMFGVRGGSAEDVMLLVTRSVQNGLPPEGVKNLTYMAMSGWKIGELNR